MAKTLCVLLAALLLLTVSAGCTPKDDSFAIATPSPSDNHMSGPTPEEAPEPSLPPDSVFIPQSPYDADAVWRAVDWVREREYEVTYWSAIPHMSEFAYLFNEGNAAYREGHYGEAVEIYLDIIEQCPTHYGAINNAALSFIQMEEYESALRYCMLNRVLNPGFYAGWVNLLVAGHALGIRISELSDIIFDEFDSQSMWSYLSDMESDFPEQSWLENAVMMSYLYNSVYADMEYQPDIYGEEAERLDIDFVSGIITEEEYEQRRLELYIEEIESALTWIGGDHPYDEDIQLLLEYFAALRILRERQQK
jgi:tetratricopeptide (TPR) repeat protein